MTPVRAACELVIAASLWGMGFVAAVWALTLWSPSELTFLRFFLTLPLLIFFVGVAFFWPKSLNFGSLEKKHLLSYVGLGFWPAFFLIVTLLFQTWGLKYTTATKSGFITTLYVLIVPFIESLMQGKPVKPSLWFCVGISLIGTGFIVQWGLSGLNFGDFLTLICAFGAAAQIYSIGRVGKLIRHPFLFNLVQSAWAMLLTAPLAVRAGLIDSFEVFFRQPGELPLKALSGLLILAFGSTTIAFYLQVRAQAKLSATVSSLLFLLESPFALVFAFLFLEERLGPSEILGALLIFFSAVVATLLEQQEGKL